MHLRETRISVPTAAAIACPSHTGSTSCSRHCCATNLIFWQASDLHAMLQSQPKDCCDAVHRLVLPPHCSAAIGCIVPEAGCSSVQPSTCKVGNSRRAGNGSLSITAIKIPPAASCREPSPAEAVHCWRWQLCWLQAAAW